MNGCGVLGMRAPFYNRYKEYCCLHDLNYDHGGNGRDRRRADNHLLSQMIDRESSLWMSLWCLLYYAAVRLTGWMFFNYK